MTHNADQRGFLLKWCLKSQSLYPSVHTKGHHGFGGIWGGQNGSWHHNLLAHHSTRTKMCKTATVRWLYAMLLSTSIIYSVHAQAAPAINTLTATTSRTIAIPDGYATKNGGTTGGGSATPVTVSTASAFRSAVKDNTPAFIIVEGRIDLGGGVSIGSNKSIMGAGTSAGLYGGTINIRGSNLILQNLTIGPASGDAMEISGGKNVFVTRCEFYGSTDELCSIVRQADYVTISWCKFHFRERDSHSFGHLIGNRDDATADRGKLHVTLHHNWYAEGLRGRMPRVRFGHVHIYNNYYNSPGSGYCIGVGVECHVKVENTHFENIDAPWADYGGKSNGEIGWANLKFVKSSQPTFMPNAFPVFTPPYEYTMNPVDEVKAIVTTGAGNVNAP